MESHEMTLDELRALAAGTRQLTPEQYEAAVTTMEGSGRFEQALIAFAVRQRGIAGEGGQTSLSDLARDTLPEGKGFTSWRTTLSKGASTWRLIVEAGLTRQVTRHDVERARSAYESSADGRRILRRAVDLLADEESDDARYQAFVEACTAAMVTTRLARQKLERERQGMTGSWEFRLSQVTADAADSLPTLNAEAHALAVTMVRELTALVERGTVFREPNETDPVDVDPASDAARLAEQVVKSPVFVAQHEAAGRGALALDITERLLASLLTTGGRLTDRRLAASISTDRRSFQNILAAFRRMMNVEGYEVVRLDGDGETVRLDQPLMEEQFLLNNDAGFLD